MRILACSLTYPLPNGVTSSVNESIDGFEQRGHQVHVVSPDYGVGKARPEHDFVRSSIIGQAFTEYLYGKDERMFGLGAGIEIKDIIKNFHPEAFWLHTLTWAPNAFERAMLKTKKPTVLTYHTRVDMYGRVYGGAIGERRMIERSVEVANAVSHVITPSQVIADKLIAWGVTNQISVIPSGIQPITEGFSKQELAKRFHFSAHSTVLIFTGRVVKEKNIDALFRMTAELIKTEPNVVLLLVGPGEIEEMKNEAKKLGVDKHVAFTGQLKLEEARGCYKGADIFVFASQSETQGLVVGEAMSAGLPVAALDSAVRPEVYPDGTADTVKNVHQLAAAVKELMHNSQKREKIAQAGHQFVTEHFSKKEMIDKQVRVFERLLQR